jgi:hypothetical protein
MVQDGFDNPLPLRPQHSTQPGRQDERQQDELRRGFELNRHYDEEQLRKREAFVKQHYGDRLPHIIEQRCDVQDEHIKALAGDYLVKNIAAHVGKLDQNVLTELAERATTQAYRFEELQREQLKQEAVQQELHRDEQSRLQPEPRQGRYYAELHETHRRVGEEMASERTRQAEPSRQDIQNERIEPRFGGRYAELDEMHHRVEVERSQRAESSQRQTAEVTERSAHSQTHRDAEQVEAKGEQRDSRRETDDRAQQRQARMREFGREIEEGFHNELEQNGGRDRGLG